MYLRKIDDQQFDAFIQFLFHRYKDLETIFFLHSLNKIKGIVSASHWHIDLPDSIEDFDAKLSSKVRYNSKWYPKKIRKDIGEYTIKKIKVSEISVEIIEKYLAWKKESYNFEYTPDSYVKDFGVTNAYVMAVSSQLLAIGFIAETNETDVYFENFAFDNNYSKYSLGIVLYHAIIDDLIKNHKKKFYLLGGNYEYKKNYNGICTMTSSGNVYRHPVLSKMCIFLINKIKGLKVKNKYKKRMAKFAALFLPNKYFKRFLKQQVLSSFK